MITPDIYGGTPPRITLYSFQVSDNPDISGGVSQDCTLYIILERVTTPDMSGAQMSDHSRYIPRGDKKDLTHYRIKERVITPDVVGEEPQDYSLQCTSDKS